MHCSSKLFYRNVLLLLTAWMEWSFAFSSTKKTPGCITRANSGYGFRSPMPSVSLHAISGDLLGGKDEQNIKEQRQMLETVKVIAFPAVSAISAFGLYKETTKSFHWFVVNVSQNTWIPVDGGKLIGDIILPALNGPVLGSITLLFATLVAMTISNLYQRQVAMQGCIIREIEDLRRLGYLMQCIPQPYRTESKFHLEKHVDHMFEAAVTRSVTKDDIRNLNEMNDMFLLLNKLAVDCEGDKSVSVPGAIMGEGYELVRRINDERTKLITLLVSEFPPLHFATMILLGTSIGFIFLLETDRDLMFFLAGFQLRILWSMLIGTLTLMIAVIYDLATPFDGSYTVRGVLSVFILYH